MNKLPQKKYYGWQTFYKNSDETSKQIANKIQSNLNEYMGKENNRQIKSISNIYLTKNVEIPLVLIECGFLSNDEELKLLKDTTYQEKLAFSIYAGLMDYFN
jgi:N-acetylmuramoyl-L-alanine amidase